MRGYEKMALLRVFYLMMRRPPRSTLFPCATLFRSNSTPERRKARAQAPNLGIEKGEDRIVVHGDGFEVSINRGQARVTSFTGADGKLITAGPELSV